LSREALSTGNKTFTHQTCSTDGVHKTKPRFSPRGSDRSSGHSVTISLLSQPGQTTNGTIHTGKVSFHSISHKGITTIKLVSVSLTVNEKPMKALLTLFFAFWALSQIEAQDRKMVYKLYKKDGKEISKQQLDSMENIHKILHFEYEYTAEALLVVVNLATEENRVPKEGSIQVEVTEQEDGSFKTSIVGESTLKEKWVGEKIFDADLEDMEGNRYSLGAKSDRVTVLNLWYTACGPCVKEMPDLNELAAEFDNDVDFLALTFDPKSRVSSFLKKRRFDYKIIPDVKEHLAKVWASSGDEAETVSTIYPVHFVIDKQGVVQEMILGAKEDIKELLGEAIKAQL